MGQNRAHDKHQVQQKIFFSQNSVYKSIIADLSVKGYRADVTVLIKFGCQTRERMCKILTYIYISQVYDTPVVRNNSRRHIARSINHENERQDAVTQRSEQVRTTEFFYMLTLTVTFFFIPVLYLFSNLGNNSKLTCTLNSFSLDCRHFEQFSLFSAILNSYY